LRSQARLRKLLPHLVWGFCCAWALAGYELGAAPILVRGDDGYAVQLQRPAQRIISLAPHLTELVYAAGAGAKLIAVSAYSDFPETAKSLPQVGDASNLDLERIVMLKPDLILAWKSNVSPFAVERLRNLSIPVYVSETRRLVGIPSLLRNIGAFAGTSNDAEVAATKFDNEVRELTRVAGGKTIVPTFIEIWHDPLLSVSGDHIMSEIVSLCGGKNILENLPALTPSIGLEALLEANPGAIVGGGSAANETEFQRVWQRHRSINAVQRQNIFYLNPDWIQRATPRILLGAKMICDGLEKARRYAVQ
jgi:iron complex transport system substrate-binding protein